MAHAHKDLQEAPLAVLAYRINQHHQILTGHLRNALHISLDLGEELSWARARVGHGEWNNWREEHCPKIARRTDALYRRLAAHRPRIEQELAINPDLTVREAVALITTPKAAKPKQTTNKKTPVGETINNVTPPVKVVTVSAAPRIPATPLSDANRVVVIGLAIQALSVARRPVSAPNNERLQGLLLNIIQEAKTVTQSPQPPTLDSTLFNKAMGLAA